MSSYIAQAGLKLFVFSLLCVCVGVHLSAGAQGEQRDQIPLEKVVSSYPMWVLESHLSSPYTLASSILGRKANTTTKIKIFLIPPFSC